MNHTTATEPAAATTVSAGRGVALLTGGGAGIGQAIARRLAMAGYDLAVLDIDPSVAAPCADVAEASGVRTCFRECDLGDDAAVAAAVQGVQTTLGGIDVLVHNAGWTPYRKFLELSEEDERRVVEINLRGFMRLCRQALPGMVERHHGRIVIVSSDAARIGVPGESVYSGAKAGLVGFGKALAIEHARDGVTVNVVSPGSTDSPMLRSLFDDEGVEKRKRANPMRRLADPDDIAGAVAYFVGDDAGYVTGQVLSINGGALRIG
jgi:2-hydroxycyclohexanecarboxyl-CoA dehydrogenase